MKTKLSIIGMVTALMAFGFYMMRNAPHRADLPRRGVGVPSGLFSVVCKYNS